MKILNKISMSALVVALVLGLAGPFAPSTAIAATVPDLGTASDFAVLAGSGIVSTNPPK